MEYIAHIAWNWEPLYTVVFDRSYHRSHKLGPEDQRAAKMDSLADLGIRSSYYVSHAPFLFCSVEDSMIAKIRNKIVASGIPSRKIQSLDR